MEKEYTKEKRRFVQKKRATRCAVFLIMSIFLFVELSLRLNIALR